MTIKELRENAGLTQEAMASKVFNSVSTIRAWENGDKKPSIFEMPLIADVLEVELFEIVIAFAPKTTKFTDNLKRTTGIANTLSAMFDKSADKDTFFSLVNYLGLSEAKGMLLSADHAFLFTQVVSDYPDDPSKLSSFILMDKDKNRVFLSKKHVLEVKPLSYSCDILNFEVIIDYPIFPSGTINDKYSIRLVLFFDV